MRRWSLALSEYCSINSTRRILFWPNYVSRTGMEFSQ